MYLWCRICGYKDRHRGPTWNMLQTKYDGHSCRWRYPHLRR
ncbi:hypothetical protein ACHAXS_001770 [Conticribra weissflogii]